MKRPGPGTRHGSLRGIWRHALDNSPICDACLDVACYLEHLRTRRYLRMWT